MRSNLLLILVAIHALAGALAQPFTIEWHSIGAGGASAGGPYSLEGAINEEGGVQMKGGTLTLQDGFFDFNDDTAPVIIFDNIAGSENGGFGATATTWLASRLCIGPQAYTLSSVGLFLNSQDFSGSAGPPVTVQLKLYSNDPSSGKPLADTGLILNLFGRTNPVVLLRGREVVQWVSQQPFLLRSNECYWAVLSGENGKNLGQIASVTKPTGDAGSFGFTRSPDAGKTWGTPDTSGNLKMLIQGLPAATLPVTPQPEIKGVIKVGNELRVSFNSVVGVSYAVQLRIDLSFGSWTTGPGAPVPGTGEVIEMILPADPLQSRAFYRIMSTR